MKSMAFFKKTLNLDMPLHGIDKISDLNHKKINVLNVWKEPVDIHYGKEEESIGVYAIKSLTAAVLALKKSEVDFLVTAPINKSNVQSKTFAFPGHTDYLAQELEGDSLMLLISETLTCTS